MKSKIVIFLILTLSVFSCKTENVIDWVFVEGGEFEQGKNQIIISPKGDTIYGFTSPNRIVQISDFYISKHEITVRQFREFCKSTGREMPAHPSGNAFGQLVKKEWEDNNPMLATWDEANEYAMWAGGRLPTEAEWEYAAKGGQKSEGYTYSGSNDPREVGWVRENADSSFREVGRLKPNELGIYDMTGNVSEWVSDWYNPKKDSLVGKINPQGPADGNGKISKGLSWYYEALDSNGMPLKYGIHMPEVRYQSPKNTRNDGFGFRIAKDQ
ncbi:MAG: SUMF1/EgtB/PvdO family nonheme iron enzyme [Cyclobacteriaceae bacterium]